MAKKFKANFLDSIGETISSRLHELTDRELRDVIRETNGVTPTNCWYVTYALRNIVKDMADGELRIRHPEPEEEPTLSSEEKSDQMDEFFKDEYD